MREQEFQAKLREMRQRQERLLTRPNEADDRWYNGLYERWRHPVATREHVPLHWRYDLNYETNPHLMERLGVNAVFNAGAIEADGNVCLVCRVEGNDRKSFFAIAESETGVDRFRFRDRPILMPETDEGETNIYDMRLTRHEDGWVYGVFCAERKDPDAPPGNESAAIARCGVARTKDLAEWERLGDLETPSAQQRNAVLHPEFVDGKYAFYTRPQESFGGARSKQGGIGWGLTESVEHARIEDEVIIDPRVYHTINEVKNGAGPPPLKTREGWLHIAHGVRGTASGLRYTLYAFLCNPEEPWRVTHRPGGYLIAPMFGERVGDVSNVVFCNGAVMRENGDVFIYYASSDTRMHVATTTEEKLLDYVKNTPEDGRRSCVCVQQRNELIERNQGVMAALKRR